jgi:hypothetical protein
MSHRIDHSSHSNHAGHAHHAGNGQVAAPKKSATFSKIFRWQPEQPGGPMPVRVEVAGSFNGWKPVIMKRDRVSGVWQAALHDLPGNRTHTYMILVNGRPVPDKHAEGLAIPHNDEEKSHALTTARGPRVFMLASQTK